MWALIICASWSQMYCICRNMRGKKHTHTPPIQCLLPLSVREKQFAYSTELKEHTHTHTYTHYDSESGHTEECWVAENAQSRMHNSTCMHLTFVHTWYKFKSEPSVWLHTVNRCTSEHTHMLGWLFQLYAAGWGHTQSNIMTDCVSTFFSHFSDEEDKSV